MLAARLCRWDWRAGSEGSRRMSAAVTGCGFYLWRWTLGDKAYLVGYVRHLVLPCSFKLKTWASICLLALKGSKPGDPSLPPRRSGRRAVGHMSPSSSHLAAIVYSTASISRSDLHLPQERIHRRLVVADRERVWCEFIVIMVMPAATQEDQLKAPWKVISNEFSRNEANRNSNLI